MSKSGEMYHLSPFVFKKSNTISAAPCWMAHWICSRMRLFLASSDASHAPRINGRSGFRVVNVLVRFGSSSYSLTQCWGIKHTRTANQRCQRLFAKLIGQPLRVSRKWRWSKKVGPPTEKYKVSVGLIKVRNSDAVRSKFLQRRECQAIKANHQCNTALLEWEDWDSRHAVHWCEYSGRRGMITKLAASGVSVRVIAEIVGHANIDTTQRYIDVNDEMMSNAVELV